MSDQTEIITIKIQGEVCEAPEYKSYKQLGAIDIVENTSFLDKNKLLKGTISAHRNEINPTKSLSDRA